MKDSLTFKIYTVDRQFPEMECDSIILNIADSVKGSFSGSYGIKKGHARAVFSLSAGKIKVYKDEKVIFSAETSDGFAMTQDNVVSVTVDSVKVE